ncbi:MAG: xylan esterase [Propionibacterium sp.]|nr:MAG: xylan esterase [Propionibacterium sp.]
MSRSVIANIALPDPGKDLGLAAAVFPGGGYQLLPEHEGAPVARWLASVGVAAAVIEYPVQQRHPAPLEASLDALGELRGLDGFRDRRLGVVGFSAGAHLAGTCCHPEAFGFRVPRPDFAVFGYPLISMDADTHRGSMETLLGPDADDQTRRTFSIDRLVDPQTPPSFVWQTDEDTSVPVINSMRYALACYRSQVPIELHVFAHGPHALGLAGGAYAEPWTALCARWLAALPD